MDCASWVKNIFEFIHFFVSSVICLAVLEATTESFNGNQNIVISFFQCVQTNDCKHEVFPTEGGYFRVLCHWNSLKLLLISFTRDSDFIITSNSRLIHSTVIRILYYRFLFYIRRSNYSSTFLYYQYLPVAIRITHL